MADAFATADDLMVRLRVSSIDNAEATAAIENATAEIQAVAGQRFIAGTDNAVNVQGYGRRLFLPKRPVTAVTTVTTTALPGGSPVTATPNVDYIVEDGWTFDDQPSSHVLQWIATPWFPIEPYPTYWPPQATSGGWPARVTVTYSYGYASIPQWLEDLCLDIAAENLENPRRLRSEQVGSVLWTAMGQTSAPDSPGWNHLLSLTRPVVA